MRLFEIDELLEKCVDPETGEFDEESYNELSQLKEQKIEDLICWYKNVSADAEALKTQEKIFKERRECEERKAESLKDFITRTLNGAKFKSDKVEVGYRKSKAVKTSEDFVKWAVEHDRDDLLTYKEPTANKTAIKEAINNGEDVPAEIVENVNIQIK